jgi:hypothetical protein
MALLRPNNGSIVQLSGVGPVLLAVSNIARGDAMPNSVRGLLAVTALAVILVAHEAKASIVYQSTAFVSNPEYVCSDCFGGSTYEALDPFTLGSTETIAGITLQTLNSSGYDGLAPFTLEIYDATHSSIVFSQALTPKLVSAIPDGSADGATVVTASISGFSLDAGSYWLGVIAPHLAVAVAGTFDSTGNGGVIVATPHTGALVQPVGGNTEYQLLGVPEPATWALMTGGFGLAGAILRRRRAVVAA